MGIRGGPDNNFLQMKICVLDKLQIYVKFQISIFNGKVSI